jgi:hypothetical protein
MVRAAKLASDVCRGKPQTRDSAVGGNGLTERLFFAHSNWPRASVDGNKLHYRRSYEINDLMVPTQKLNEVKDFFHQIAADERASAILRRAN